MVDIEYRNGIKIKEADRQQADNDFETDVWTDWYNMSRMVASQLQHHFDKYGVQRVDDGNWLKIIIEELGEMTQELNKQNWDEFEIEMAQTIACLVRLYNEGRRMQQGITTLERDWYTRAV